MDTYDAIVVGAGHNGLIAALYLAGAGYHTLVLERSERVGGCIQSAELTRPGFIHDVYSTNMNLFLGSPAYAELKDELEANEVRFVTSERPYCNVFPDGESLRVYREVDETLRAFREHNQADAEGWELLYEQFKQFQKTLLPLYGTPLPSAAAFWALGRAAMSAGVESLLDLATIVLSTTRELGEAYFSTEEARALLATWGLHLDFGPDVSGGGLFPFLEAFSDMEEGMALVEGGAQRLVEALAAMIRARGGEVRTGSEVTRILTEDGEATGVELADGTRLGARKAVVANLVPTVLFDGLLADADLPKSFRDRAERYAHGPATMMVHLALDRPAPWSAGEEIQDFAYVHIAPYVDDLATTYTSAQNGLLPESPLLIVGQTTAVDSSRTPGDEHILWIQVRALPHEIQGDAAGLIEARSWEEAAEPVAERVLDKLEAYAPGLREHIIGRKVLSPADLEAGNPNLVGGDSTGGSHHLHQNFLWRPFPGWSRYKMPIDKLYMVGAGTWPGGGNNGTSGYLAARQITRPWEGAGKVLDTTAAGIVAAAAAVVGKKWLGRR